MAFRTIRKQQGRLRRNVLGGNGLKGGETLRTLVSSGALRWHTNVRIRLASCGKRSASVIIIASFVSACRYVIIVIAVMT